MTCNKNSSRREIIDHHVLTLTKQVTKYEVSKLIESTNCHNQKKALLGYICHCYLIQFISLKEDPKVSVFNKWSSHRHPLSQEHFCFSLNL